MWWIHWLSRTCAANEKCFHSWLRFVHSNWHVLKLLGKDMQIFFFVQYANTFRRILFRCFGFQMFGLRFAHNIALSNEIEYPFTELKQKPNLQCLNLFIESIFVEAKGKLNYLNSGFGVNAIIGESSISYSPFIIYSICLENHLNSRVGFDPITNFRYARIHTRIVGFGATNTPANNTDQCCYIVSLTNQWTT